MENRTLFLILCILCTSLIPQDIQPCTTFCLDNGVQLLVGKNTDFITRECLVFVNKRGVSKIAMTDSQKTFTPIRWTSRYGSITFNQWGREFPFSGMNEAGLVVSATGLQQTKYPTPDKRPTITLWQWIQYQLDNFSLVKEVIQSDLQLRIPSFKDNLGFHYLVIDKEGNCAVVEFLDGVMVHYTNKNMPTIALTGSNPYSESTAFLYKHIGWGGDLTIPQGESPLERFVRVAYMLKKYNQKTSAVIYAFDVLKAVEQGIEDINGERIATGTSVTEWSIVYDIKNLHVYFRTLSNQKIRHFDLSTFDFFCSSPVKVLDIHNNLSGDISNRFIDYTYEINNNLVRTFFKKVPLLSNKEIDIFSHYPETTICTDR